MQLLIQVDEEMARQLEKAAPGRSRKRSRFIRLAIQRALMDLQERATRKAYERWPDHEPAYVNPGTWARRSRAPRRP